VGLNKKDVLKFSFITLVFLALIVAWLGFGERGFIHLYRMEKERQAYLTKIRNLEKQNRQLLEQINQLHTDKDYIESVARRELGLVKEDEVIYKISREHVTKEPTQKMDHKNK
jgi:cell division protein FtsB